MADERTVIFKLQLDSKALTASAKEAEAELAKLQPKLKEVADASGKNSVEYRTLEAQVQKFTKQLKDSSAALAINEELSGKSVLTTEEQARAKKALSTAYNRLTEDEKKNTEEGRRLTDQLRETNEALQAQGLAVSDGRGSVGLYEKSIISAKKSLATLQKEATTVGYAIGQNTKKLDDNTQALADLKAKGLDPTDKEYKRVSAEVEFYTEALEMNKKTLREVETELNAQTEALKTTEKEAAKIGFVYGEQEEATKSLKTQLKELKAELATEVPGSDRFNELTAKAGELADRMKDVNEAVGAQASGSRFEQLSNQAGLLKDDLLNLDFEGVAEKAAGFQNIASKITLKEIAAGAQNAVSALGSLAKTIITSPLFLLVGAGVAIYAFWDDIKEAIWETDHAQAALNETLEDFKKGASDASKKTLEVEAAFKNARKGVISKEEALLKYNETLGDSFGKATSLNEAEAIYASKTEAFVKAAGLRAQAQALFAKSADEVATALTAGLEDQTSFLDKVSAVSITGEINVKKLVAAQKEGIKEAKKDAEEKQKIFEKEAQNLLTQAEQIEKNAGIQSEGEKQLNEELARLADERAAKAREAAEKRIEAEKNAIEKIRALILGNRQLSDAEAQQDLDVRTNYRRKIAELESGSAEELASRLLEIEKTRIAEQQALNDTEKSNRIAALKEQAEIDIKAAGGTAEQIAQQEKLIREQLRLELEQIDNEYTERETQLLADSEAAKQALKDEQLKTDQQRAADRLTILQAQLQQEETRLREAGKTEEEIAKETAGRRIEIARLTNDIIEADTAKSDAEKLKAQADYEAELLRIKQQGIDADLAATQAAEDQKKQLKQAAVDAAAQLIQEFYAIEIQEINSRLNAITESNRTEQEQLANKLEAGVISQEKYNADLKKLEIKKAREEAKIKKEAFEKQKQADLISAGISVAKAVIAGYTTQPFLPVGIAMGTLALALGTVQLSKIAGAQTPAFAEGGRVLPTLSGQRIGEGDGMPIFRENGDNLLATVRKNEVILNEKHQARAGGPSFFRRIGVPGFATGGATSARIAQNAEQSTLNNSAVVSAIANMALVVDVKDVIRETGRRVQVEDAGNVFG
jgi:hypothetical protein